MLALLLALSLSGTFAFTGAQEEPIPTLETLAEGPGANRHRRIGRLATRSRYRRAGRAGRARGPGGRLRHPETDPILTTNIDTGEVREFAPGEAFYAAEDSTTRRESVTDEAVPYSRIALVDADDADDPGGDTLVLAGEPFELRPSATTCSCAWRPAPSTPGRPRSIRSGPASSSSPMGPSPSSPRRRASPSRRARPSSSTGPTRPTSPASSRTAAKPASSWPGS